MKSKTLYFAFVIYILFTTHNFCLYLDLGLKYFINGQYKIAEYMFKQSYINNEDPKSLLYLANAYYVNKKYAEANKSYRDFLNEYSLNDELRSFAEFMLAETLILCAEYEKAIEVLNRIDTDILNEVFLPYLYYNKIFCYFKLGEYSSAINSISLLKAYVKNKKLENFYNELFAQVDFILAESWYAKGNYKKAIECYEYFVNNYKTHKLVIYAKLRLANILEEQKKYEQASQVLKTIELKKDPQYSEIEFIVNYNTARLLTRQKKYFQAIKLYQQLIEQLKDENVLAYIKLELAYCYYQIGKYENVLKLLTNLPNNLDQTLKQNIMFLTGLTFYSTKNYNEAIKVFKEFRKKFSTTKWTDDVIYWLGLSYYNQKQPKQAAGIFAQINKNSIYYISANIYLARCYRELKEYDLSKLILTKLLQQKEINENLASIIKYEIAECYKLKGEYQIAMQYYEQLVNSKTVPPLVSLLSKISTAEIYLLSGDYTKAEDIIQELQGNTTLTPELSLKCKILYVLSKYYRGEFELVEKLIQNILKSETLLQDDKKTMLTLLSNIYLKTQNFVKAIETMEKLSALESDEKKFLLQLRILKLAVSQSLLDIVTNKLAELQKLYRKPANLCILSFYQAKYYANVGNEKLTINYLEKIKTFPVDAFKFFTKDEFVELFKLCSTYKPDIIEHVATQIVPYLSNDVLSYEDKKSIMMAAVDKLIYNNMHNQIIKILAIMKKTFADAETSVYVEFKTAQICELTGKVNLAEKIYKEIITSYPKTSYAAKSYIALIQYYYTQQNNELAAEYEKKLISEFPDLDLVHAYFYQKVLDLVEKGKYEEAIRNITFIVNSKDKNIASNAQKILADCYYKLGQYKEAAVEYLRVLYLYPDNTELCAEAQYRIGECAEKLKLYDEAKKAYTNSKNKYPGTLWAQEAELKLKQLR